MQRSDVEELRELLSNMHAPDCHALKEEVLVYPEYCDCNVSSAFEVVDRMQRAADVAGGDATLDVVRLTFDDLRNRIAVLEQRARPVVDSYPRTRKEQIKHLREVL